MKTTKKKRGETIKATQNRKTSPGCIGVSKSITKSSGHNQNSADTKQNTGLLPSTAPQPLGQHLVKQDIFPQTTSEVPRTDHATYKLHPSTKVKLQLFPIDEDTRIKLEKDGYNPFLELTLRARKKISSVIKHIDTKWGSSTIATGELVLVPYSTPLENIASENSWTLNDTCISAGDVYAAMDSPAVFRLRYGWFSNPESSMPFESNFLKAGLGSNGVPKASVTTSELTPEPNYMSKAADEVVTKQISMDLPANHADEDMNMECGTGQSIVQWDNNLTDGIGQPIVPWDDNLTNLSIGGFISELSLLGKADDVKSTQSQLPIQLISDVSIGGLLYEASLQAKTNNLKAASNGSKSTAQEIVGKGSEFSWFDSLTTLSIGGLLSEASLQEKIHSQQAKPLIQESSSSILDAEETCHAFSFQKSSSSIKGDPTLSGSARLGSCSHTASSESAKVSSYPEKLKTDNLTDSGIHSEDSYAGLTGIRWNDSLGPFDLGVYSLKQVFGGDSISFSRIIQ